MNLQNQLRSKTFMTIKWNIIKSTNYLHLTSCQQMIENAYSILDRDELTILNEFMADKEKQLSPLN